MRFRDSFLRMPTKNIALRTATQLRLAHGVFTGQSSSMPLVAHPVENLARKHLLLARGKRVLSVASKCAPNIVPAERLECQGVLVGLIRRVATTG